MNRSIKFAVAAATFVASQLACADTAEVRISNLTLSVQGGEWWYWLPANVDWLSQTAGTTAQLDNPAASQDAVAWHGASLNSTAAQAGSFSQALISGSSAGNLLDGTSASAKVVVDGGQSGWAFANVFSGQIMVGGNATITVQATIESIGASGSLSQANAYIDLCSAVTACVATNFAEAVVDGSTPGYSGPLILTASWTNPGATTYTTMSIGLTAAAASVASPVPEPSVAALWLGGLAGVGFVCRQRRRQRPGAVA